jgi:tRNA (cytidine/uridine-2'-O-)-methyltransferase
MPYIRRIVYHILQTEKNMTDTQHTIDTPYNIVLLHPEIPPNTGNIGRLCVNTGTRLHLIEPLGFSFEDKHMKRAGLDYWPHLDCTIHPSWDAFLASKSDAPMYFFSTKTTRSFWDCPYAPGAYLVYGCEGSGLPPELYERHADELYTIPMFGEHHRSYNLANAVAITLFEGLRSR